MNKIGLMFIACLFVISCKDNSKHSNGDEQKLVEPFDACKVAQEMNWTLTNANETTVYNETREMTSTVSGNYIGLKYVGLFKKFSPHKYLGLTNECKQLPDVTIGCDQKDIVKITDVDGSSEEVKLSDYIKNRYNLARKLELCQPIEVNTGDKIFLYADEMDLSKGGFLLSEKSIVSTEYFKT